MKPGVVESSGMRGSRRTAREFGIPDSQSTVRTAAPSPDRLVAWGAWEACEAWDISDSPPEN
ncbi:hypothetical protein GCM10009693_23600 [Leucobacter chromiireducens subsp. chromiireducens]